MTEPDPRVKYRQLPTRVEREEWIEELPTEALPGSIQAAADDEQLRTARYEAERSGLA